MEPPRMNDDDFEQMIGPRHCYLLKKGGSGFICGDLGDHCTNCGTVSDVLCDFPVGDGKTCDRAICEECAHEVAPDVHYYDQQTRRRPPRRRPATQAARTVGGRAVLAGASGERGGAIPESRRY